MLQQSSKDSARTPRRRSSAPRPSPAPPQAGAQTRLARAVGNQSMDALTQARLGDEVGGMSTIETAPGVPVVFGLDTTTGRTYLSVTYPGRTPEEVAFYLYGVPDPAPLEAANGPLPVMLGTGETLRAPSDPLAPTAREDFLLAQKYGAVVRTEGVPQVFEESVYTYKFSAAGKSFELTVQQYVGMLRSSVRWIRAQANRYRANAQIGRETRSSHIEESNSWVRAVADWWGDADLPSTFWWDSAEDEAKEIVSAIDASEIDVDAGELVRSSLSRLELAAMWLDRGDEAWHRYIEATVSGAEGVTHALELVRDVSFGIAAGLAGAVAAPAVFAAAGGGLLGGGAAVGAGAVAGAGTDAALELGSSTAGEGLAMAVTPGDQDFDLGYVGERTWEGAKSGAIQGGLGAAGALAAPGVSNVISQRIYGRSAGALSTTAQRYTVNALSAAAVGAPSGAVSSAIENVDDLARGDISAGEYGKGIFWSGVFGAASGAGTSVLPVHGLYRTGGRRLLPFSGEAVTPRWTMEGFGYHPHQVSPDFQPWSPLAGRGLRQALRGRYSWNPPAGFSSLPLHQLPALPPGHRWIRLNGEWHPIASMGRFGDPFSLRWQSGASPGEGNLNMLAGRRGQPQRLLMSRAFTRSPTYSNPQGRSQQGIQSFVEPATGTPHTPGHNIDYADTLTSPLELTGELPGDPSLVQSNVDPFNFTPEPRSTVNGRSISNWGQYLRNNLVARIRSQPVGGGYRQYNLYGEAPRIATGSRPGGAGTLDVPVPDSVIFVRTDAAGNPTNAWRVSFQSPPTSRSLSILSQPEFQFDVANLPQALAVGAPVIALPVGGEGAALSEVVRDM